MTETPKDNPISDESLEDETLDLEKKARRVEDIIEREVREGHYTIVPTRFRAMPLRVLELIAGGGSYPPEVYARVREDFQHGGQHIAFEVHDADYGVKSDVPSVPVSEVKSDLILVTRLGDQEIAHPDAWERDNLTRKV